MSTAAALSRRAPSHRECGAPARSVQGGVIAREIHATDIAAVARLLHEGFPSKSAARFSEALALLGTRPEVPGLPVYGQMLQVGAECVGALLTVASSVRDGDTRVERCNVACWYVQPSYRLYASMLVLRISRNRDVTHVNIWPAENTWPTIRSQGFKPVCDGTFAGMPALVLRGGGRIMRVSDRHGALPGLSADDSRTLRDHASYGCISLIASRGGRMAPFIFRPRRFRRLPVAGAQLIYCRSIDDLQAFAGPVGRYLVRRGLPWILAGTSAALDHIPGRYFADKMPIYSKGPNPPAIGDLRYTEVAMFGF